MSSDLVLIGSCDYRVVALSIVIAVLGSYAALDLGERVTAARNGARLEFTRLFGYTPQKTLGRRLSELIVPDDSQAEEQQYTDLVAKGQRVDVEGVRQHKDGSRLQVSMLRVPVSVPGGQVAVYAIYRDISERKRAEAMLQTFSQR